MPDSSLTPSGQTFDEVWAVADRIPGWMTKGQAELLDEQARRLPDGSSVLEIGSHQGRSTVVLGRVMKAKRGRVIAVVQPHRFSRLGNLMEDFQTAFNDADRVLVT